MERSFGIEMEIVGINQNTALAAVRAINVSIQQEGYNHTTRSHWKIVSDASVHGGFEVVSPVLRGEAGIAEAQAVAEALADAGATVNRTCGLHVHFDASDLGVEDIRTIVKRYAAHEAEIDAFMPVSRRGDANRFCQGLARVLNRSFMAARSIRDLATAQGSRYFKVNLQSHQRHGTIEFRQHSGTVNARKIANWIRFLAAFIDQSKAVAAQPTTMPVAEHPVSLSGKAGRLARRFAAERVIRLADFCAENGWLAHSGRAVITRMRRAGMDIRPTQLNGEAAYELVSGMAPVQTSTDSLWAGVDQSVVTFYTRRTAVLRVAA